MRSTGMKFNTKCMKSLHKMVTRCRLTFSGFVHRMISVITFTVVSKNIVRLGDAQVQRRYYFTRGRGAKHCHELVRMSVGMPVGPYICACWHIGLSVLTSEQELSSC